MYAYCLFCQTQKCEVVATLLQSSYVDRAFSPQVLQRHRKQGKIEELFVPLLPGYVFLYTEEPLKHFLRIRRMDGVIRFLTYADGEPALRNADLAFAMDLYARDGRIGAVKVLKAGQKVRIEDQLFAGFEGEVLQMDRRKQRAQIRFKFDNIERTTWIACDIIFPKEEEKLPDTMEVKEEEPVSGG